MGGDLGLPGLGLSEEDRQTLTREVHYIVHSAASISFVDHIHNLISHNYIVSPPFALHQTPHPQPPRLARHEHEQAWYSCP